MSSSGILRREKDCLNCGHEVGERYCTHCGQENLDLRIPFWKLVVHFISDYFHYEHKLFRTLAPLLFKPGSLTRAFREGRRSRFIHPFRLYIFISIVYFAVFFSVHKFAQHVRVQDHRDTVSISPRGRISLDKRYAALPSDIRQYEDSVKRLPENKRPSRFEDFINRKIVKANSVGERAFLLEFFEKFSHNIPKILFLFLPIVALLLKLLYIGSKRYYTEHFVFALHTHAFLFLLLLLYELTEFVFSVNISPIWIVLFIFVYVSAAMKRVYEQSWLKTVFKFFMLSMLYLCTVIIVALINIFIVIFTI